MIGWLAVIGFLGSIPAANWLIGHVGTSCIPDGPCLVPVAPGLMAPSGVLMIGLALVLRDVVHEHFGVWWVVFLISVGAVLSVAVASPWLAIASGTAFLLSEMADLFVYTPLRRRQLGMAVLASGAVGAAVDSAAFLWLAFGSLDYLAGQIIGKLWMSLVALPVLYGWRRCFT